MKLLKTWSTDTLNTGNNRWLMRWSDGWRDWNTTFSFPTSGLQLHFPSRILKQRQYVIWGDFRENLLFRWIYIQVSGFVPRKLRSKSFRISISSFTINPSKWSGIYLHWIIVCKGKTLLFYHFDQIFTVNILQLFKPPKTKTFPFHDLSYQVQWKTSMWNPFMWTTFCPPCENTRRKDLKLNYWTETQKLYRKHHISKPIKQKWISNLPLGFLWFHKQQIAFIRVGSRIPFS